MISVEAYGERNTISHRLWKALTRTADIASLGRNKLPEEDNVDQRHDLE
jgi:hypothetical protein